MFSPYGVGFPWFVGVGVWRYLENSTRKVPHLLFVVCLQKEIIMKKNVTYFLFSALFICYNMKALKQYVEYYFQDVDTNLLT